MPHPSESLPTLGLSDASAIVRDTVYAVTPIGQGIRSRVYRVETEDGSIRIVRLTPKGSGRLEREAWVRVAVGRNPDVPLLAEIAVHDVDLSARADIASMAELPGSSMMAATRNMFEPEVRALYERFGAGLAAIHSVTVAGYGLLDGTGTGAFPSWRSALDAAARASTEEARVAGLTDLIPTAERTIATLLDAVPELLHAALLHGDAQPTNVQIHRGKVVAFLDFEFASGGDPAFELAYVEPLFEPSSLAHNVTDADLKERRAAFYRGYASRRPLDEVSADRTRLYRLIHALRGAEFLSVMGPKLALPARLESVQNTRASVERWL